MLLFGIDCLVFGFELAGELLGAIAFGLQLLAQLLDLGFEISDLVVAALFDLGEFHRAVDAGPHGCGIAGVVILPHGIDVIGLFVVYSDGDAHTVPV